MDHYQRTRQFYTYIRQVLHVDQASVNIQCERFDTLAQIVMDALAFDGAVVYEGRHHDAQARIVIRGGVRYFLSDEEVDPSLFEPVSEYIHGSHAVITKDESG